MPFKLDYSGIGPSNVKMSSCPKIIMNNLFQEYIRKLTDQFIVVL